MNLPEDVKYTEDHEWGKLENDILTIGITDFAQSELGDIIFVEFPDLNTKVSAKDSIGTLEAVKTVADIYSPIDGEIIEINNKLEDQPEQINSDSYNAGWIVKIKYINLNKDKLLTPSNYKNML